MKTILLISPYWKEPHRWMVSSVKLAELWQRMGYRVVVVCMGRPGGREDVSQTLTIHRVPDLFLPDPLNYGIAPALPFRVYRVLRAEHPDIVIVNKVLFYSSLVVPCLRILGHRPIVTTDTLVGMTWWPRGLFPRIIMAIGAWTAGWQVLLSAWRIVFFHPQPKALLKALGIAGKSRVIPTGIDASRFQVPPLRLASAIRLGVSLGEAEPRRTAESRREASAGRQGGVDPGCPPGRSRTGSRVTVTYVGRLESVKGVDDFLAATVPLRREFPKFRVQVVGWHKDDHPLVRKFAQDVTFTGLRDDVREILAGTDIFVLPSYSEGLSNALMEAMASGCACIATKVGGNTFLIEDGVSGLLFQPGNRAALTHCLYRLIEHPEERLKFGAAAQERIRVLFDWNIVEKKYATLFADVSR